MFGFILCAALGGAIGAALRFVTNLLATSLWGEGFLYGILGINVIGSFLMGVLFVIFAQKLNIFAGTNEYWAVFLMTGVLGGFTTFSAFSLETWKMIERQAYIDALIYVAASVLLSIGALILAVYITRSVS